MTDPFLNGYSESELRIASEFLTTWLPYLSRDLCLNCTHILSHRIFSISSHVDDQKEVSTPGKNSSIDVTKNNNVLDNGDIRSSGNWNDETESNSRCQDGVNGWSEPPIATDASSSEVISGLRHAILETPGVRMSWADMTQEEELEGDGDSEENKQDSNEELSSGLSRRKPELTREQREFLRLKNVRRKKDFLCVQRVKGKLINILHGLELHTGVFSAVEQKKIVDHVYELAEMGKNGKLKERTFQAPKKWMRGKGRVTIQFGCCYNYATDKKGNPPGILRREEVDPLPSMFKVIIKRLIRWGVIPPSCVPDSCIVNIYDEGDCIPPHIDNHDFVRPFCTISFLSECNILFGTELKIEGPGVFSGDFTIPLPVGSVLVLNGNGADVAKHCVPAVPSKRISITFRRMDEAKRPAYYAPEPDLQDLKLLSLEDERSNPSASAPPQGSRPILSPKLGRQGASAGSASAPPQGSRPILSPKLGRQGASAGSRPERRNPEEPRYHAPKPDLQSLKPLSLEDEHLNTSASATPQAREPILSPQLRRQGTNSRFWPEKRRPEEPRFGASEHDLRGLRQSNFEDAPPRVHKSTVSPQLDRQGTGGGFRSERRPEEPRYSARGRGTLRVHVLR